MAGSPDPRAAVGSERYRDAAVVLAIIAQRPAHGYDITASLRQRGFEDIAEGTVYALLVRVATQLIELARGG